MGVVNFIFGIINSLGLYILVLISVAYLTLAERKVLGYSQCRKKCWQKYGKEEKQGYKRNNVMVVFPPLPGLNQPI